MKKDISRDNFKIELSEYNKKLMKELKNFKKEVKELGIYHESKYELKSPYDLFNNYSESIIQG